MVARVVVAAGRRPGRQLYTLAKVAFLYSRACCIPLFADFHPAPDETPVIHDGSILLLHYPHAAAEAVIRKLRPVCSLIDGGEALHGVPLVSCGSVCGIRLRRDLVQDV